LLAGPLDLLGGLLDLVGGTFGLLLDVPSGSLTLGFGVLGYLFTLLFGVLGGLLALFDRLVDLLADLLGRRDLDLGALGGVGSLGGRGRGAGVGVGRVVGSGARVEVERFEGLGLDGLGRGGVLESLSVDHLDLRGEKYRDFHSSATTSAAEFTSKATYSVIADPVLSRSLALKVLTLKQSLVRVGLLRLGRSCMNRTTSETTLVHGVRSTP
jgi:hypothetical protein